MASRKPAADDEPAEGITYRTNGSVTLHVAGIEIRLRPALLEDYAELVQLWRDSTDDLRFLSDTAVAWSTELQTKLTAEERPPTPDERTLDVKYGREITDRTDELAVAWWKATIARMAPPETVPVLAAWMVDPSHITAVINHWREVPSRSGGR